MAILRNSLASWGREGYDRIRKKARGLLELLTGLEGGRMGTNEVEITAAQYIITYIFFQKFFLEQTYFAKCSLAIRHYWRGPKERLMQKSMNLSTFS